MSVAFRICPAGERLGIALMDSVLQRRRTNIRARYPVTNQIVLVFRIQAESEKTRDTSLQNDS